MVGLCPPIGKRGANGEQNSKKQKRDNKSRFGRDLVLEKEIEKKAPKRGGFLL